MHRNRERMCFHENRFKANRKDKVIQLPRREDETQPMKSDVFKHLSKAASWKLQGFIVFDNTRWKTRPRRGPSESGNPSFSRLILSSRTTSFHSRTLDPSHALTLQSFSYSTSIAFLPSAMFFHSCGFNGRATTGIQSIICCSEARHACLIRLRTSGPYFAGTG